MVFTTEARKARRTATETTKLVVFSVCLRTFRASVVNWQPVNRGALPTDSRHGVQLRHVPPRRPAHETELVQPHHRVVTELEIDAGELRQRLKELGLFFEQVQRHLGVQPDRELTLAVLVARALEGALEPAGDDLRREYPAACGAGRAVGRQ